MKENDRTPAAVPADERVRLAALAQRYRLTLLDELLPDMLDPELIRGVSVEWARGNAMLPVRVGGAVCVVTDNPDHIQPIAYLEMLLKQTLRPVLAPRALILDAIDRCYFNRRDTPAEFIRDLGDEGAAPEGAIRKTPEDLLARTGQAPVIQLVNLILLEAVKQRSSDIHFEPLDDELRVRYRIDGVLYAQPSPPKPMADALISRIKIMSHLDIAEKRLPQDGTAKVHVGEREIDIRVSTVPVAEGERVVLRLLDARSALLPLGTLGMTGSVLAGVESVLARQNGVFIVAGPTGSGKTTTLYAALGRLDASRRNILTIEDPMEYRLPGVGQIQVRPKIGLTFAQGLRHILRQDPDVILVGEIRDQETAEVAVRAALTGHLVFTTLHTNDAPGAILRLADMGVEPYLLSSCILGVLAQRLVRTLCPKCRRPVAVDGTVPAALQELARARGGTLWGPAGCAGCLEGYRGRSGIFELMPMSDALRDVIHGGALSAGGLRQVARAEGLRSLQEDGFEKALDGVTTWMEVESAAGR